MSENTDLQNACQEQLNVGRMLRKISFCKVEEVKDLVAAGYDVNAQNRVGDTALMEATRCVWPEKMKQLLKYGADVNSQDEKGWSALCYSRAPETTRLLLRAGANPNVRTTTGKTPLFLTCNKEILSVLLQAGANPNARADDGSTPLFRAETWDCAAVLLAAGADINAQNNTGETALFHLARVVQDPKKFQPTLSDYTWGKVDDVQNEYELWHFLLMCHPDLSLKNNMGQTALDVLRDKSLLPEKMALTQGFVNDFKVLKGLSSFAQVMKGVVSSPAHVKENKTKVATQKVLNPIEFQIDLLGFSPLMR